MKRSLVLSLVGLLVSCGGGGGDGGNPDVSDPMTPDADPNAPDADPNAPDATIPPPDAAGTSTRLITADYSIAPGDERYQCFRVTASEDMYITSFTPTAGEGTHHTILAIDTNPSTDCGPLLQDWTVMFASGVASPSLNMPPGVAFPVRMGDEVVFSLHLFNAGDTTINAQSAIDVTVVPVTEVTDEAEVLLVGPVMMSIPPGSGQTETGKCRMRGNTNFFAVFPHMHQLGTHIKVWARQGMTDTVVHDQDYAFEAQGFTTFAPIALGSSDEIHVECTYNNTTGGTVGFGDSSTQEMCFAISYRYPPAPGDMIPGAICWDVF